MDKKECEGAVAFYHKESKQTFYKCEYSGECVWKLNYEQAKLLPIINPLHPDIPFFQGFICNCPDFDRHYRACPSKLTPADV